MSSDKRTRQQFESDLAAIRALRGKHDQTVRCLAIELFMGAGDKPTERFRAYVEAYLERRYSDAKRSDAL